MLSADSVQGAGLGALPKPGIKRVVPLLRISQPKANLLYFISDTSLSIILTHFLSLFVFFLIYQFFFQISAPLVGS